MFSLLSSFSAKTSRKNEEANARDHFSNQYNKLGGGGGTIYVVLI